jgi:hypothetical protein
VKVPLLWKPFKPRMPSAVNVPVKVLFTTRAANLPAMAPFLTPFVKLNKTLLRQCRCHLCISMCQPLERYFGRRSVKEQVVNFDQSLGPFFVDTIKSGIISILGKLTGLRPTPLVALGIN